MTTEQIEKHLQAILEINMMIAKQNSLLVQTLTLPKLMFSEVYPGSWTEYGADKEKNT